ncbi:adenine phosphoribosyltransferase [Mycolicibacterium frederiksbergense]|uniref:Adenine phosphoribosyltransferase n=1 Tax=Mycolicibacterium frederiksbergense TaxID=117567 RepID=A0A6H0SBZ1_9MYCO|nr:adenine phosphoribosyltransferase [Mycolicibacterium frederiksbergense]QIV84878.1 adenine phosphoribosyltransferase [Mycolicibacterium frederiksbergense]
MSGSRQEAASLISALTRHVADFPIAGVDFKDLTPVLADPRGLAAVTDALAEVADGVDLIAGVDARGFLLGAAVALKMGTGVLAVRKGGKLPPPVHTVQYDLEYGSATLEIPADGIDLAGRSVLVIDDVLATGGTLVAAAQVLEKGGARVTGAAVVLELTALNGRAAVQPLQVTSLIID